MVRFATDENFNRDVLRGLLQRRPELDVISAQDAGWTGAEDPLLLAWTAEAGRVLLTHDRKTMPPFAYERIAAGLVMPGVVIVDGQLSIGEAIEELTILIDGTFDSEWEHRVHRLPLR